MTTIKENRPSEVEVKKLGQIHENSMIANPYLLPGLLRRGQTLAITAPKKSLKTSLAIQLALSSASQIRWLDWDIRAKCNVLYININHSERDCLARFYRAFSALETTKEERNNIDTITVPKGKKLKDFADWLINGLNGKYDIVIIDSLDNLKIQMGDWDEPADSSLNRIVQHFGGTLVFTQSHRHRPVGNLESREKAEWSDSLNYADSLLEFVKMRLDPELLRRKRLEAVWELSKKVMTTHNRNYFLMNVTDKYLKRSISTSEELRDHVELALDGLPEETREGILKGFDLIDLPLKNRSYWRMETVTTETPEPKPKDFLFYYPELKKDHEKILAFHEPGKELPKKYLDKDSLIAEANKEKRTNKLVQAIEDYNDKYGHSPTQKDLSEFMGVDRTTIYNWVKETEGAVFLGPEGYDFL